MEASILLVIGLALSQVNVGEAYYQCEEGEFHTLYKLTEECRLSQYAPFLKSMRKKQQYISGGDIVNMLRNYCKVADQITSCVQNFVDVLPCLEDQQEYFDSMMLRSNWYCDGHQAKEAVVKVFQDLPMEKLDYRKNKCYRETPQKAYECVRKNLKSTTPDNVETTQKKTMDSFKCTYRKLSKECARDRSLLLTTVEYDYLIVPPALGLNITEYIMETASLQ